LASKVWLLLGACMSCSGVVRLLQYYLFLKNPALQWVPQPEIEACEYPFIELLQGFFPWRVCRRHGAYDPPASSSAIDSSPFTLQSRPIYRISITILMSAPRPYPLSSPAPLATRLFRVLGDRIFRTQAATGGVLGHPDRSPFRRSRLRPITTRQI